MYKKDRKKQSKLRGSPCGNCQRSGPCNCITCYDKCGNKKTICAFTGPTGPTGPTNPFIPPESVDPFGPGNDGDREFCGNNSFFILDRDYYFNNLTICENAKICTNGYRIFVRDTLDLQGTIENCALNCVSPQGTLAGGKPGGAAAGIGTVNFTVAPYSGGNSLNPDGSVKYSGGRSAFITNGAGGATVYCNSAAYGILSVEPNMFTGRDLNGNLIEPGGSGAGAGDSINFGGASSGPIIVTARKIKGTGTLASVGGTPTSNTGASLGGGSSAFIVLNYRKRLDDPNTYTFDVRAGKGINGGTDGSCGAYFINKMS